MAESEPFLKGHLNNPNQKDSKVYVIQFPSPFQKDSKELAELIKVKEARKQFFQVFKTSKEIQLPKNKSNELNTLVPNNESLKTNKEKDAIPEMVRKNVKWLYDVSDKEATITKEQFLTDIISSILFTIQYELRLNFTLLESRDKDEIFCEIFADEEWLLLKAEAEGYRLQFKDQETNAENLQKFPFKAVPPYAKFEVPEGKNIESVKFLFKHYDENEKVNDKAKSIFTYTDRVRLVRNSLNTRLDLFIMKELEISIEDFCLHSEEPLKELKHEWANFSKIFSAQPLDKIRDYYGEKAALYYGWMDTYRNFMFSAAILGLGVQIVVFLHDSSDTSSTISLKQIFQVLFAIFLALWASTFDQVWTRKEKIFAWRWGTTFFYEEEEQRGPFKGKSERDPVTNKIKRKRDSNVWHKIAIFASYSVIMTFIVCVVGAIGSILYLRFFLLEKDQNLLALISAGFFNAVQIKVMDIVYGYIAVWLNDWENHETETEYNNKLAIKIFMFKFVNSYTSLFYLAYFANKGLDCDVNSKTDVCYNGMDALAIQLAIIFALSLVFNVIEIIWPWLIMKRRVLAEDLHVSKLREKNPEIRENLFPVEIQAKYDSYESPLEDYIEMIIEFGYVVMFATALPVLPLFLLLEIIVEIRVDAWKMCNNLKRADPHRSEDIGVFKDIIVFIAYVGAINNAGLVVYPAGIFQNLINSIESSANVENNDFYYLLIFIALEHLLLLGMFLISLLIPDEPEVVKNGLIWSERVINKQLYDIDDERRPEVDEEHTKKHAEFDFIIAEGKIKYYESS